MENNIDKLFREKLKDMPLEFNSASWNDVQKMLKDDIEFNNTRNNPRSKIAKYKALFVGLGLLSITYVAYLALSDSKALTKAKIEGSLGKKVSEKNNIALNDLNSNSYILEKNRENHKNGVSDSTYMDNSKIATKLSQSEINISNPLTKANPKAIRFEKQKNPIGQFKKDQSIRNREDSLDKSRLSYKNLLNHRSNVYASFNKKNDHKGHNKKEVENSAVLTPSDTKDNLKLIGFSDLSLLEKKDKESDSRKGVVENIENKHIIKSFSSSKNKKDVRSIEEDSTLKVDSDQDSGKRRLEIDAISQLTPADVFLKNGNQVDGVDINFPTVLPSHINVQKSTVLRKMPIRSVIFVGFGLSGDLEDKVSQLGFGIDYQRNNNWGLSLDFGFKMTNLKQKNVREREDYKVYSFNSFLGEKVSVEERNYKMNIPLLLTYKYNRLNVGLGGGIEFFNSSYGVEKRPSRNGIETKKIKLALDDVVRKQYFSMLELDYNVTRNIQLGASAQYLFEVKNEEFVPYKPLGINAYFKYRVF